MSDLDCEYFTQQTMLGLRARHCQNLGSLHRLCWQLRTPCAPSTATSRNPTCAGDCGGGSGHPLTLASIFNPWTLQLFNTPSSPRALMDGVSLGNSYMPADPAGMQGFPNNAPQSAICIDLGNPKIPPKILGATPGKAQILRSPQGFPQYQHKALILGVCLGFPQD